MGAFFGGCDSLIASPALAMMGASIIGSAILFLKRRK